MSKLGDKLGEEATLTESENKISTLVMSHHFYNCFFKLETEKNKISMCLIWIWTPQINLASKNMILNVIYWTLLKTTLKMNTFSCLKLLQSERTIQFMWNPAHIMVGGTDFKTSFGRRIKTNLWAMRLCCCNKVMCRTFMGVSSDQRKNGATAVGTHTLTSVDISSSVQVRSNTFFTQFWWQMLFIAGFDSVISELYLSLYPYLAF